MRIRVLGIPALIALLSTAPALAGPPFQTDDPDPVPYQHYEAYLFSLSDGTPAGGTTLEAPSFEGNWGAAPDLQLHLILPLVTVFTSDQGATAFGIGDTELGAKYRFIHETERSPEVGIFPMVELPTGDVSRGLGVGSTWFRLPLWVQKSWGAWTTYGGGGEVLTHAEGFSDFPFAGWLLQRQLNESVTLAGELYGHGGEGSLATSSESAVMFDFGGFYSFSPGFQLLFSAGRSIAGQTETYTYFALYWTWGKSAGTGLAMLTPPGKE